MVKVYIAGLLWEKENRMRLEKIDNFCKNLEFDTYLPHRDSGIYDGKSDPLPIFTRKKDEIDACDFMIAILDWKGIGYGTAWELGYAYAKNKKVFAIAEDKKSLNKEFRMCVMCFNSVIIVENLKELKNELKKENLI